MAFVGSANRHQRATKVRSANSSRRPALSSHEKMATRPRSDGHFPLVTKRRIGAREGAAPAVSLRTVPRAQRPGARPSTEVRDAATKKETQWVDAAVGRAGVA
jgi:hypothetical protein